MTVSRASSNVSQDDGRTAGTALLAWDTGRATFVSRALHAPTNGWTESAGGLLEGVLTLAGEATDRRGPRIFSTRYVRHDPDHYTVHTDVSFDQGVTWIDDQMVMDVTRSRE